MAETDSIADDSSLWPYRRLIAWSVKRHLEYHDAQLGPALDVDDLIQETFLRLIKTLRRRERPEMMTSYIVQSARRVVLDLVIKPRRLTGADLRDLDGVMGRVTVNRRRRLERKISQEQREEQARKATSARWAGHESVRSEATREAHRLCEQRRRARKRIKEQDGEIPRHLKPLKKTAISLEEKRRRERRSRKLARANESEEQRRARLQYQRMKTAEYRSRKRGAAAES